ncbi:hypothetical protein ACFL6D_02940 [Spirochaetota bacterium]
MKEEITGHISEINRIVEEHFTEVDVRIESVNKKYFSDPKEVFARHWRNKKDIPSDLAAIPRHTWNIIAKYILKKKTITVPKSGKQKEVEAIIYTELLDIGGLEKKIEEYVKPYQEDFEAELRSVIGQVPVLKREEFSRELERNLEDLNIPVDGVRETVMFLMAGVVGKVFADNITFGSMLATGKSIAISMYMSQLSWFGYIWASIFGTPAWVSVIGIAGGVITALLVAPLISPLFEMGINRIRARRVLRNIVSYARKTLTEKGTSTVTIAGKIAVYLQILPDCLEMARKAVKLFI